MIAITRDAATQVEELLRFYIHVKERPEAADRLRADLADARGTILALPLGGGAYPRPYPSLARLNFRWLLVRVYWFSWKVMDGRPVLSNVLHVSANIEARASSRLDDITDW